MRRILLPILFAGSLFVGADAGEKDKGIKEPPPGFTSLFNGKDLSAWKDADKQPEWKVEDGLVHYTGKGGKNLDNTDAKSFIIAALDKIADRLADDSVEGFCSSGQGTVKGLGLSGVMGPIHSRR